MLEDDCAFGALRVGGLYMAVGEPPRNDAKPCMGDKIWAAIGLPNGTAVYDVVEEAKGPGFDEWSEVLAATEALLDPVHGTRGGCSRPKRILVIGCQKGCVERQSKQLTSLRSYVQLLLHQAEVSRALCIGSLDLPAQFRERAG